MVYRLVFTALSLAAISIPAGAQIFTEVVPNKSHREGTNFSLPCPEPPLCDYHKMVTWDDSQIKQYAYRGRLGSPTGNIVEFMNWRMAFPLNYDPERTEKYPMIVMLHGAGESGRIWTGQYNYPTSDVRFDNNGHNLLHGGTQHWNAVNRNPNLSNSFPGIVIWPQASYNGAWENGWNGGNLNDAGSMVVKIIEWILQEMNVDPDRIYMHGLSNGGKGTWDLAAKRPDLFAAILPMAGVGSDNNQMAPVLNTMPLWLFQGGTDTNPRPQAAADAIAALQAQGGSPRYTLYPTLGHGVWNTAYAEADFFPWMKNQSKKNIYVFGGDPNICASNNLKLGFSANMLEYVWYKDDVEIPGSNNRFLTINQPGTYKVRYRRRVTPKWEVDEWAESNPVTIGLNPSTVSPLLTNTGSIVFPTLGGVNEQLYFSAPIGYTTYYWFKDGNPFTPISPASSQTSVNTVLVKENQGTAGQAGNYTVKVLLPNGCQSEHSNTIAISFGTNGPGSPTITSAQALSSTEIKIDWTNVASATGYEVWRYRPSVGGYFEESYKRIITVPQGTLTFTDNGLRPAASYRYRVRAVNSGGGSYSVETNPAVTTIEDSTPPTPPLNLVASNITDTQATLSWELATDNDVVYSYQVYNGSSLITTLTHPYTSWTTWNSSTSYTPNVLVIHNNRFYRATTVQPNLNQTPPTPPAWSAYWDLVDGDLTDGKPSPPTTYTVTGLEPNMTYTFSVRAVDWRNNYSPFADAITVSTQKFIAGLDYRYYQLSGSTLPPLTTFDFDQNPTRIGQTTVTTNFVLGNLNFGTATSPYILALEGYLLIPSTGTYTFRTQSNDGSMLYLDLGNGYVPIVNNDGQRGNTVTSTSIPINFTTTGRYPIRVTYSQISVSGSAGTPALTVQWDLPGGSVSYSSIPTANLSRLDRTFYYLKTGTPGDDPSVTTAWTTNSNGANSNTAPVSAFTDAQRYFVVTNRPEVSLNNSLTISGTGSKIIVGNGSTTPTTFNVNAALNATLEANQNSTININHSTLPKFGVLHETSTTHFNLAGTINLPSAQFGNVVLNPAQYNLPENITTVRGNLVLENGTTTSGVATNLSTLRIGGDLIVNNTSGNPFPANGDNQYSMIFTGSKAHTVSFVNAVNPNFFSIQADFGDVVQFSNLSGNTFTVGSGLGGGLVLKGGSRLDLGNNHLIVNGRGTINSQNETGSLAMMGGNFTLNTAATQNNNVYFNTNSYLNNLTLSTPTNNRLSVGSSVLVSNLVTVSSGQLNAGEGFLTLRSVSDAANGTARIGPLLNGASITGKIKVQRYMSGEGRIYRYISSPVAGVSAADLQEFFPITGNFTGASSGPGLTTGNASMFHYNETLNPQYQQFPSVGGTNLETLQRGKGYVPFIRQNVLATVWEVMGEPHQGSIPFTLTGGTGSEVNGWNLLGNPYPAPIKWNLVGGWTRTGVNAVAYVRENSNGTTQVKSHNGTTGTNGWDGVIAPGQAFWVRTETASPTLIVNENAKQTTDGAFYREGWPVSTIEIIMRSSTQEDGTIIQFTDGATAAFDSGIDGSKLDNTFFNLSSLTSDNKPMVINLTTPDYCMQEVKLRITNASAGTYHLEINGVGSLLSSDKVTLIDHFLDTEAVIDDDYAFSFNITSDPASMADGRFVLRFEKPEVRLDMTLESFAACEQANPVIRITNAQPGVEYTAFHNNAAISEGVVATSNVLDIPVNPELISYGNTQASLKAGFRSCNSFDVPQTIVVHRDTLTLPEVSSYNNKVMASIENAQYVWYFEGEELLDETGRIIEYPLNGEYQVEVTLGSCTKISDPYIFVITSLETHANENQPHPNPTKDKVVVTLEQPIALHTVRTVTVLGQVVQAPATPVTEQSIEVNLSELPAGLYFLYVNERRYRIIKE